MKLYFENSYGERRIIAEPITEIEAWKEVNKFCEDRNFKIHYIRSWQNEKDEKVYDVGSWSEFFYLVNET
jgi:hypothetical protein